MGLLNNFPHKCTIQRRKRTDGALGGNKDSPIVEQTNVVCWEQQASASEIRDFEKKGMSISRKVYFLVDPVVTARHQILITERKGVAQSSPINLDVMSHTLPYASAGLGVVYKVMVNENTGANR